MSKLFLVFCFLAVAATGRAAERIDVVFLNPGGSSGFWGDVSATMAAAARDLSVDLEIIDTDRDRIAMLAAAEEIASRAAPPDYVILVNELEQGSAMMRLMARARIPTLFLLNRLSDAQQSALSAELDVAPYLVGSITPDNEIAGYEMATSLIDAVRRRDGDDAPVRILAILGDATTPAALAREAGLRRAVEGAPTAQIVRAFPVLWDEAEALRRTDFALQVLEVDAIWGANDDLALAGAAAARNHGLAPGETIFLSGLNWSSRGLQAVAAGDLTLSHGGHYFGGAWAMVLLRDVHEHEASAGDVAFPMSAVTRDNVALFIDRLGERDWDRIDFVRFTRSLGGRVEYDFSADAILSAAATSNETVE